MIPLIKSQNTSFAPESKVTPYDLGDAEVVEKLVVEFVHITFDAYKRFQRQEIPREEALGEIDTACQEMGDIFMCRDDAYYPNDFIREGWLAAHVRAQDAVSFKVTKDPGEAFFRWLAFQAIEAAKDLDNGTAPEEVGPSMHVTIRSSVSFLLGLGA